MMDEEYAIVNNSIQNAYDRLADALSEEVIKRFPQYSFPEIEESLVQLKYIHHYDLKTEGLDVPIKFLQAMEIYYTCGVFEFRQLFVKPVYSNGYKLELHFYMITKVEKMDYDLLDTMFKLLY